MGKIRAEFTRAGLEFKAMRWRKGVLELFMDDFLTRYDQGSYCRMLDTIVVSFIILETLQRRESRHFTSVDL